MSKDSRVQKLFEEIDQYLANNFSGKKVTEWSIGSSHKCDIKWQKTIDDFITFKIYEPRECEGCIAIERRNNIGAKYTMHLPDGSHIQNSDLLFYKSSIAEFLENFKTAMSKKENIYRIKIK
jgi:hypothetical protein